MKYIISALLITCLSSCNQPSQAPPPVAENGVMLGFNFGMTERQAYDRVKTLVDSNQLDATTLQYNISLDRRGNTAPADINPLFAQDSLYQLEVTVYTENVIGTLTTEYDQLYRQLTNKYGEPTTKQPLQAAFQANDHDIAIKGDNAFNQVKITYTSH